MAYTQPHIALVSRLPIPVHTKLKALAAKRGISLNTLTVEIISSKLDSSLFEAGLVEQNGIVSVKRPQPRRLKS